ncbi:hypothetical protein COY35_00240 [candidate division WWE3 bacterium CG_4_10_14_0_2_um_filter_47_8]|nr:MAG: hypothetical protein COY35_00240 [candidate division WWE3 bacterium CG_4_10_14_0_2_um_filter_47_8]
MKFLRKEKMENKRSCCEVKDKKTTVFWSGLVYGLLPHSFCLIFLILSIGGSTAATAFFRNWLLMPAFFLYWWIFLFGLVVLSALVYLYRIRKLSWLGIKEKKGYLLTLFAAVVGINLLLYLVVFPLLTNLKALRLSKGEVMVSGQTGLVTKILKVEIPCSGHAPLVVDELQRIEGVREIRFRLPNFFEVSFDSSQTS